MHYFTVVLLLAVFLAAELSPFYLKVCVCCVLFCPGGCDDVICGRVCCGWNQIILSSLHG